MSKFFNPQGEQITYEIYEDAISRGESGYTSVIDNLDDFSNLFNNDADYEDYDLDDYEEQTYDGGADYGE